MKNRTSIITLAAFALTGAAAITSPSHAQIGATVGGSAGVGVPNVTVPTDSVRQGAAGINSAQAEATRTTGDAVRDAQARAENEIAREGLPSSVAPNASVSGSATVNTPAGNAQANAAVDAPAAANEAARAANEAANRGATTATGAANRAEAEVTQQLNRDAAANAAASGSVSTR